MSILSGNDFTSHKVKNIKFKIENRPVSTVKEVAAFVQEWRNVDNHPVIREEMVNIIVILDGISFVIHCLCMIQIYKRIS